MDKNEIGNVILKAPKGASMVCVIQGVHSYVVLRTDKLLPGAAKGVWEGMFGEEKPDGQELKNGKECSSGQALG